MNIFDWARFGSGAGSTVTPVGVLFDLCLAFVLGQVVAWLYMSTHRGVSYSRNMIHSIVLLTMIVAAIMEVVGDSVARAFGLMGALSLIRFRTVVRDARDTTYIFLALSVGIAIGAQHYAIAIIAAVGIGLVGTHLHMTGFAARHADTGVLRVRSSGASEAIEEVVRAWCRTYQLLTMKESSSGESEYSYEIRLYHPTEREDLLLAVRGIAGTSTVTVALEERAEEW